MRIPGFTGFTFVGPVRYFGIYRNTKITSYVIFAPFPIVFFFQSSRVASLDRIFMKNFPRHQRLAYFSELASFLIFQPEILNFKGRLKKVTIFRNFRNFENDKKVKCIFGFFFLFMKKATLPKIWIRNFERPGISYADRIRFR